MAAALLSFASSSHAALIHQFELNGSLADSVSGKSLQALGGKTGDREYVFGPNQGLTLDTRLGGVYSIGMDFRFDALYSYNRIIDFKNRATDNGFYTTGNTFILYPHTLHGGGRGRRGGLHPCLRPRAQCGASQRPDAGAGPGTGLARPGRRRRKT
jgi:hypothetical protein